MRQFNFLLIFVVCLALVLFSLQNSGLATIYIFGDLQFQAPLAIELIVAMFTGAVLAWVFSAWIQIQQRFASSQERRQLRQKDKQIQTLEQMLKQPTLPPGSEANPPRG